MFSIMIVKHHNETLLEYKRKEVLVKRIDVSINSSPLIPSTKYRALYFPGFAGQNLRKISEFFQAPVEPAIMDNCNFPPGTQCGFLGIFAPPKKRGKKKDHFTLFLGQKSGVFRISEISQQKNTSIKSPAEGTCRRESGKRGFSGVSAGSPSIWDLSAS